MCNAEKPLWEGSFAHTTDSRRHLLWQSHSRERYTQRTLKKLLEKPDLTAPSRLSDTRIGHWQLKGQQARACKPLPLSKSQHKLNTPEPTFHGLCPMPRRSTEGSQEGYVRDQNKQYFLLQQLLRPLPHWHHLLLLSPKVTIGRAAVWKWQLFGFKRKISFPSILFYSSIALHNPTELRTLRPLEAGQSL